MHILSTDGSIMLASANLEDWEEGPDLVFIRDGLGIELAIRVMFPRRGAVHVHDEWQEFWDEEACEVRRERRRRSG